MKKSREIVCLDIGAAGEIPENWKDFSNKTNIKLKVFAFDEDLSKNKNSETSNINLQFIPFLLGKKEEVKKFYILNRDTGSSVYKINPKYKKEFHFPEYFDLKKIIDVSLKPLKKLIENEIILSPDVIKIDTQGSELDIFVGLKNEIDKTMLIETEVEFLPIYEKQPLFKEVDDFLKKNDFELFDLRTHRIFHTNGTKQDYYISKYGGSINKSFWTAKLIAGDALYIKKQDWLEKQSNEKIDTFLNILLMYNCYDYAFFLLDQLYEKSIIDLEFYKKKQKLVKTVCKKNVFIFSFLRILNRFFLIFGIKVPLIGYQYYGWTFRSPPDT